MIAGIVLCGGSATRLGGGDKPLRSLGQTTILGAILDRFLPQVDRAAISANGDPSRFVHFGLPVVPDTVAGRPGPLGGVLAGLRWAAALGGCTGLLSTAGDTPFIPSDLMSEFATKTAMRTEEIVVAASAGRIHPVVALWPLSVADALEDTLRAGDGRVLAFIEQYPHLIADFAVVDGVDPFFNVNSPRDLIQAQAIATRIRR